jgi:hypothetical protein
MPLVLLPEKLPTGMVAITLFLDGFMTDISSERVLATYMSLLVESQTSPRGPENSLIVVTIGGLGDGGIF